MKQNKDLSIRLSSGTSRSVISPIKKSRWTRIETLDTEFAEKKIHIVLLSVESYLGKPSYKKNGKKKQTMSALGDPPPPLNG